MHGWHEVRQFFKIWSPGLLEIVFTAPHGGGLYKVVPSHTKRQHVQNYLLAVGIYYLYKSAHL